MKATQAADPNHIVSLIRSREISRADLRGMVAEYFALHPEHAATAPCLQDFFTRTLEETPAQSPKEWLRQFTTRHFSPLPASMVKRLCAPQVFPFAAGLRQVTEAADPDLFADYRTAFALISPKTKRLPPLYVVESDQMLAYAMPIAGINRHGLTAAIFISRGMLAHSSQAELMATLGHEIKEHALFREAPLHSMRILLASLRGDHRGQQAKEHLADQAGNALALAYDPQTPGIGAYTRKVAATAEAQNTVWEGLRRTLSEKLAALPPRTTPLDIPDYAMTHLAYLNIELAPQTGDHSHPIIWSRQAAFDLQAAELAESLDTRLSHVARFGKPYPNHRRSTPALRDKGWDPAQLAEERLARADRFGRRSVTRPSGEWER